MYQESYYVGQSHFIVAESQEGEGMPGLGGIAATGGGDIGRARATEQTDGGCARRREHAREGADADLGAVFSACK